MDTSTFHFEQFQAFSPYTDIGPYRAEDYWKLPEGEPVELLRGRLIVSPSPNALHQTVIARLVRILQQAEDRGGGMMFVSPMDVILSDDTILQPDLLYIAKDRRNIIQDRIHGAPDLAIEILSPGTSRRDKTEKLDLYRKYGVAEYWVVDPDAKLFEFLLLEGDRYSVVQPTGNSYQSSRLPEIEIDVEQFWSEIQQRLNQE